MSYLPPQPNGFSQPYQRPPAQTLQTPYQSTKPASNSLPAPSSMSGTMQTQLPTYRPPASAASLTNQMTTMNLNTTPTQYRNFQSPEQARHTTLEHRAPSQLQSTMSMMSSMPQLQIPPMTQLSQPSLPQPSMPQPLQPQPSMPIYRTPQTQMNAPFPPPLNAMMPSQSVSAMAPMPQPFPLPLNQPTNTNQQSNEMSSPLAKFRPPSLSVPQPKLMQQQKQEVIFNQVGSINPFENEDSNFFRRQQSDFQQMQQQAPMPQFPNYEQSAMNSQQTSVVNTPYGGSELNTPDMTYRQMQGVVPTRFAQPQKRIERIDPKQIPRPSESKGAAVKYYTRSGTSPPAAGSDFCVIDEGNASPRFIRLTTNNIAAEQELIDSTKLCIGAIIQPLAELGVGEEPVPVIDYSTMGEQQQILRCSRCLAYVNPFFTFTENGNAFICNICNSRNSTPDYYKCNLDANGLRRDRLQRPELCRGSVEFTVGKDFINKPISEPCWLFVIDVSYGAIQSGLVNAAVEGIRNCLQDMTNNPRNRIGVITYDSAVQFYSLKATKDEPTLLVMGDIDDFFVPCPVDEICVRVSEPTQRMLIEAALDLISRIYNIDNEDLNTTTEKAPAFGAAVSVAAEALIGLGGKVLMIQSALPSKGCGALQMRDNINFYYTDKEKTLQAPQNNFYSSLATKCAQNSISVDLYVCAPGYVDLATIGALCEKTGGQVFNYPNFDAQIDSFAFENDLKHNVTRYTGFDAIMVVRSSAGLKVVEYFGNFFHEKIEEIELSTIDSDKSFGVRFEHEQKLKDKTEATIQCALLYTTPQGERRIRVHTISVQTTSVMSNIFRFADLDAILNLSLKQAVRRLLDNTTCDEAQNALTNACIESLYVYRKFCASATSAGQLILPEPLKLLPLCTLGLIKHSLFQDGISADEKSFLFLFVNSMPVYQSQAFVCPKLYDLSNLMEITDVNQHTLPNSLTLSSESVKSDSMYLLDNARMLYLYIAKDVNPQLIEAVFERKTTPVRRNVQNTATNSLMNAAAGAKASALRLRESDDPSSLAYKITALIQVLRKNKSSYQSLHIICHQLPQQNQGQQPGYSLQPSIANENLDIRLFFSHLIEDAISHPANRKALTSAQQLEKNLKPPNCMSYIDFLCWIHKRIQNKFY